MSSTLTAIECVTVIRRMPPEALSAADRRVVDARLNEALEEVAIKSLDDDVVDALQSTPALGQCRSLDAAHVATALYFRAAVPELEFCTFDDRMADVASRCALVVRGR